MDIDEEDFLEGKRRSTAEILYDEANNERRWKLSHLKDEFESFELHKLFNRYIQRISHGYFSQFLTLQILLITSHFIVLLSIQPDDDKIDVLPDLILYGLISLFSIILLVVTDTYVKKRPKLLSILSVTAFVMTFFMNAFVPFYNRENKNLRPAYTPYLIISNYIFLNIRKNLAALVMGVLISIFHVVMLILITYEDMDEDTLYAITGSDVIFLLAINCLGIYFRYMNEIVIRRSFLDKRDCIDSTLLLKFEEEQEKGLMTSVIPKPIIAKVRNSLMEYISNYIKQSSVPLKKPFNDLYVKEHTNVTILFADIVNYTMMTSELDVTEILDILNELFTRFDEASEKLKVLRVKFLGDCYYCVAGLPPDPPPNHAEACVDLGLEMISVIAEVRQRKNLDINMRIGIHSGSLSSGIIGTLKWQYDIWSKDVDIANKMETEGVSGMVHITEETKSLLTKTYDITESTKKVNDKQTYLVRPRHDVESASNGAVSKITQLDNNNNNNNQRRMTIYIGRSTADSNNNNSSENVRNFSLITNYQTQEHAEYDDKERNTLPSTKRKKFSFLPILNIFKKKSSGNSRISTNARKRRTLFMNTNVKRREERLEETNMELEETIEAMLLSKFEQWFKTGDMYRLLLIFKDFSSELDFIKTPDPLFKYYLLSEVLILFLVYFLQNLTLSEWDYPEWPFFATLSLIVFVLLPATWTHYFWTRFAKSENDLPSNAIISLLYNSSKFITNSFVVRTVIYTALYVLFCTCVLSEWIECYETEISVGRSVNVSSTVRQSFLMLMTKTGGNSTVTHKYCLIPWHITETFALAIIMSFLFLRMYMWLKLLYAAAIAAIYAFCILQYSAEFYGDSQSFNFSLSPQASHIIGIFFLTLILHLVDRQTEYMNRIDYLWYKNLIEKEEQVNNTHKINTILLLNILPVHVVKLYLNVRRPLSDEVYNRTHPDVAVLFATITNFFVEEMGNSFLPVMSAIISEFDLILLENMHERPIEKIKIAKWTYMAACGLGPRSEVTENVISLLKFATRLMRKLKEFNQNETVQQNFKLRIGMSHGPVAAGVVGSRKPLYDIWGTTVNMASRMDTLGLDDHIQVEEATARIIEKRGYVCRYRDKIAVKGRRELVPTYFVELDENFELVKREELE